MDKFDASMIGIAKEHCCVSRHRSQPLAMGFRNHTMIIFQFMLQLLIKSGLLRRGDMELTSITGLLNNAEHVPSIYLSTRHRT